MIEQRLGTLATASVHPREAVKHAMHHHTAAVLLVHNHPSGLAESSQADIEITRLLQDALKLVEVRLLDHVVASVEE